jgi:hypothetical protein
MKNIQKKTRALLFGGAIKKIKQGLRVGLKARA